MRIMPVPGTYQITVKTPVGPQQAKLVFCVEGAALSGFIENVKGRSDFSGGTVTGGEVRFSARISTPIGRIRAEIVGRVDGDRFTAAAKLPLGKAEIEGIRI
ncbi:MAG TPA: hypothetical protein DDZ81_01475 [Acetobacteraceae bacterium]|nr:hypothetical protein [Acetobacteraceae bacterium]